MYQIKLWINLECGLGGLLQTGRHGKSVQMAETVFENRLLIPFLNQLIPSWGRFSNICFLMTRHGEAAQLPDGLWWSGIKHENRKSSKENTLHQFVITTSCDWFIGTQKLELCLGSMPIFYSTLFCFLKSRAYSLSDHKQRNLWAFWESCWSCCLRSEAAWLQVRLQKVPCPT